MRQQASQGLTRPLLCAILGEWRPIMAAKKPKKGKEPRNAPEVTRDTKPEIPKAPPAEDGNGTKTTPGRHKAGRGFRDDSAF